MGWGRAYFALQACAGALWWITVFTIPAVRHATLGGLDPWLVAAADVPLFVVGSAIAATGSRAAALITTSWTGLVTLGLAVYATATTLAGWGAVLMIAATAASVLASLLVWRERIPTEWLLVGPFRSREADADASPARNVLATAMQIVVFWGVCLGIIPLVIAAAEERWRLELGVPPEVPILGVVLFVAASALGLWSAAAMSTLGGGTPLPIETARRLVVRGPYRFVRNPMAMAGIAQGVAVGMMLSSWLVVVYALAGSWVWNHAIRPHEERDLEQRFGDDFRTYRAAVRCWWPAWHPASASIAPRVPSR
ncbi:protein-S-isoprenylcysteine O-methyltransferase Ste14 [Microbacterium marinum]|uniref:Protein-S-isoprenylcysteine O-methyltransferase Ste14 n=1 Tax=Microbacterium marinum TaxID=421115 RepID=A0A7W7FMG0_9MICO|nr:isoprenylcysteine carboxylmethyltransferase family protein [Microbacterium marinum]MBB4668349.1 protein-S-isoprenylcysteine O-methyltransferase Ste14 [Microbacterium marinum]